MRVLLLGASGFIGRRLAAALEAAGDTVLRAGRSQPLRVDLAAFGTTDWPCLLAGVDAVVNAAGVFREQPGQRFTDVHTRGPQRLFDACVAAGVERVVHLSALGGAGANRAHADRADRADRATPDSSAADPAFLRSKHVADAYLLALPLDATVVQPSLVFGPEGTSARLFVALAALPWVALPAGGRQVIQPVHVDDVVAALVALVHAEPGRWRCHRVAFVGPAPLTLREYVLGLRAQLGLAGAPVLALPAWLMALAARAGERWPRLLPLMDRDAWRMLQAGSRGDPAAFAALLGRAPRPAASFVPPGLAPLVRQRAELAFALPLLRAALAFVWAWTAVVSLWLFPEAESLALLDRAGVPQALARPALWSAAALDLVVGVLTLAPLPPRGRRALWAAQAILIAGYTAVITWRLPEFWLHPYGPISKNLPILAVLALLGLVDRGR